jgi:hypothetical protein
MLPRFKTKSTPALLIRSIPSVRKLGGYKKKYRANEQDKKNNKEEGRVTEVRSRDKRSVVGQAKILLARRMHKI